MIGLQILKISCQFSKNLFWYTSATCGPRTGGQSQFKIPPTHTARHTHKIWVTCVSVDERAQRKKSPDRSALPFTKKNSQSTALSHDLSFISLISAPAFLLVRQYWRRRATQCNANGSRLFPSGDDDRAYIGKIVCRTHSGTFSQVVVHLPI